MELAKIWSRLRGRPRPMLVDNSWLREFRIEHSARHLVQKLAREAAAVHAANVVRLQRARTPVGTAENIEYSSTLQRLDRAARNARIFRDQALILLRRDLGLPDEPTQSEIGDWGAAP
jgi:hypothetical protein